MTGKGRRRKSRRKSKTFNKQFLSGPNITIVLLVITSMTFVASVLDRHSRGGLTIPNFRQEAPPGLCFEQYDDSLLRIIELEVLNGCGISGLAQQFTDYLRDSHVDVVRTENADNFHYDKTLVILRRDGFEKAEQVARLLDLSPRESVRVMVKPDASLLTDITVVIGSDYLDISPVQQFLATQP